MADGNIISYVTFFPAVATTTNSDVYYDIVSNYTRKMYLKYIILKIIFNSQINKSLKLLLYYVISTIYIIRMYVEMDGHTTYMHPCMHECLCMYVCMYAYICMFMHACTPRTPPPPHTHTYTYACTHAHHAMHADTQQLYMYVNSINL